MPNKRKYENAVVVAGCLFLVCSSLYLAYHSSPLIDEGAHFASGVILDQTSDPSYFKVNPPLNKWITASVAWLGPSLSLPPIAPSESFSNLARPEFYTGENVQSLNKDHYMQALRIARYARILFLIVGTVALWRATAALAGSRRMLCMVLWCTSPLLLGHGWVVSADAPAAVAMCFVILATIGIWQNAAWSSFALSGAAWGIAIGSKFTLGPLYLFYPVFVHLCAPRLWTQTDKQTPKRAMHALRRFTGLWAFHALVACLVVDFLYLFQGVGVPLNQHEFHSREFSVVKVIDTDPDGLTKSFRRILGHLPSPLPVSFLEGVDQQMLDMTYARGAYLLGERIPGEIHWFFLVGFLIKERLVVCLAVAIAIGFGMVQILRGKCRFRVAPRNRLALFSALYLLGFSLLMSTQSKLVWNIRYLTPAVPLVSILMAYSLPKFRTERFLRSSWRSVDITAYGLTILVVVEMIVGGPYYFSYINPAVGGAYRVPIALNDSNFDYGQDLFFARRWADDFKSHEEAGSDRTVYGIMSGAGNLWLEESISPATLPHVLEALNRKKLETQDPTSRSQHDSDTTNRDGLTTPMNLDGTRSVLLISRGLTHAEPWAWRLVQERIRYGSNYGEFNERTEQLLRYEPDFYVTPVIAGYFLSE